jgi:hypothetical protein
MRCWCLEDAVRVIRGGSQTDFMVKGVDKATGVKALLESLGGGSPLAFAVGDTASDLPVLKLARVAFAPANADEEVRRSGVEVVSGNCQRGLAQVVARVLGHYPGSCPCCGPHPMDEEAELMCRVLSAQSSSRWGKVRHAGQLAISLWLGGPSQPQVTALP